MLRASPTGVVNVFWQTFIIKTTLAIKTALSNGSIYIRIHVSALKEWSPTSWTGLLPNVLNKYHKSSWFQWSQHIAWRHYRALPIVIIVNPRRLSDNHLLVFTAYCIYDPSIYWIKVKRIVNSHLQSENNIFWRKEILLLKFLMHPELGSVRGTVPKA